MAGGEETNPEGGGWGDLSDIGSEPGEGWGAMSSVESGEGWGGLSEIECEGSGSGQEGDDAPADIREEDEEGQSEQNEIADDEYAHGLGNLKLPKRLTTAAVKRLFSCVRSDAPAGDLLGGPATLGAVGASEAGSLPLALREGPEYEASGRGDAGACSSGPGNVPPEQIEDRPGVPIVQPQRMVPAAVVNESAVHRCIEQCAHIVAAIRKVEPTHPAVMGVEEEQSLMVHLMQSKTSMTSVVSEAALADTSVWTLQKYRRIVATAMYITYTRDCVRMLTRVARDLLQSGCTCIALIQKYKGDETQLKFRVSDTELTRAPVPKEFGGKLAVHGISLQATSEEKTKARVLQSHREIAGLFCTDSGYMLIRCRLPQPLQVMASCTQEVYNLCYQYNSLDLTELSQLFDHRVRLCVNDGDTTVAASMRAVASDEPGFTQLSSTCEIHYLANRMHDCMSSAAVQSQVSSMIAFASSLDAGNHMKQFREALRLALAARLMWSRRAPRAADAQRNAFLANLCIRGNGKTEVMRRDIILALFNGAWERTDIVEHNCIGPMCCADRDACLNKMVTIGTAALAACAPPLFRRDRWTGVIEAISWPLLLESIHGLLAVVYKLWAFRMRGGQRLEGVMRAEEDRLLRAVQTGAGHTASGVLPLEGQSGGLVDGGDGGAHLRAEEERKDAVAADPQPAGPKDEVAAKRQEMALTRDTSVTWVSQDLGGTLLVLRLVSEPIADAIDKYLATAGMRWERMQAARLAHTWRARDNHVQQFRVTMAASGEMVGGAIARARELMRSSATWKHLPFRFRSASLRTRATLILSQAGCGLFRLLCEHQQFPIRLFSLLLGPGQASDIDWANTSHCLFDAFTEGFVTHWKRRGGLGTEDCLAELRAIATMHELENSEVEAHHASIRRMQVVSSTQTTLEHIQDASADFILRRYRHLGHDTSGTKAAQKVAEDRRAARQQSRHSQSAAAAPSKDRAGPWRAFIRQETLASRGRPDFADLARKYNALSDEEQAILIDLGHCAKKAAVAGDTKGMGAFGPTSRMLQRSERKRAIEIDAAEQLELEHGAMVDGEQVRRARRRRIGSMRENSHDDLPIAPTRGSSQLADSEQQRWLHQRSVDRKVQQLRAEDQKKATDWFREDVGPDMLAEATNHSKSADARKASLLPVPDEELVVLEAMASEAKERIRNAFSVKPQSMAGSALYPMLQRSWEKMHLRVHSDPALRKRMLKNQREEETLLRGWDVHLRQ